MIFKNKKRAFQTLVLIILTLFFQNSFAQDKTDIKELLRQIEVSKKNYQKLELQYQACNYYLAEKQLPELKEFSEKNIALAKKLNNSNYLSLGYSSLAAYYFANKDTVKAENKLKLALKTIEKTNNDSIEAQIYFELGQFYTKIKDYDKSILEHKKALEIYNKNKNLKKEAESYNTIGQIYKSQSKYLLSINNFENSLKIQETLKDTAGIVRECINLGGSLTSKFNYGEAFNYYLRVTNLLDADKNIKEYTRVVINIGVLHRYNKEYDIALDYFERVLKMSTEKKYEIGIMQAKVYIAYTYIDKKEFKKALKYTTDVLKNIKETASPISLALKNRAMGDVYTGLKNLKKGLYYYNLSLEYSIKGQNNQYIVYAHLKKAQILFNFNKLEKANEEIKIGLKLSIKNSYLYLQKQCYLTSAKIQFALKNKELAYQQMNKAYLLQEELSLQTQKKGLTDAQTMFRTNLLQQDNKLKEKQLEAKNAKLRETEANSRFKNLIILTIVLLFFTILVFAYFFRKKNREISKNNEELEIQNSQISAQKEMLQKTLDRLKKTQNQLIESEKMASLGSLVAGVAHEMNTPIGIGVQASSAIVNRTAKIAQEIKELKLTKHEIINYIEHTYQSSSLALSNLKRTSDLIKSFKLVSVDQSKEEMRVFNMFNYISDILITLKPKFKKKNISIQIDCNSEIEINSYPGIIAQIITNLVLNSLKHGFQDKEDGEIKISFQKEKKDCLLTYADDGNGMSENTCSNVFEPFFTTNKQTGTGLGMHIIYNLITQQLNGNITCRSKENEGVLFEIKFQEGKNR